MSGPSFSGLGPFDPADLTWKERWERLGWLEQACARVPEAQPALRILRHGCHTVRRRDDALRILNSLPSLTMRRILSRYLVLSTKKKGEAA